MRGDRFLYFAYGPNMVFARLRNRCDSAQRIGVAALKGHELRWHKPRKDGFGQCDIVESAEPEAAVFGVLYAIATDQKAALDRAEGGYAGETVELLCDSGSVKATAYRANAAGATLCPYDYYCRWILYGAREHGLPKHYIRQLEALAAGDRPLSA